MAVASHLLKVRQQPDKPWEARHDSSRFSLPDLCGLPQVLRGRHSRDR